MKLIYGLGNKPSQYQNTRHNIGAMMVSVYARKYENRFKWGIAKTKRHDIPIQYNNNVILLHPQSSMNDSGRWVCAITETLDIVNDDVLVLHDDVDLDLGRLKAKAIVNNGRHKGISDIGMRLGTSFGRLKIGVGKPQHYQTLIEYVLSDFGTLERECLCDISYKVCEVIDTFIAQGIDITMAKYNGG